MEKKLPDFTRSRSTCHLFDFGHEVLNLHFMIQEYILLLVVFRQINNSPLARQGEDQTGRWWGNVISDRAGHAGRGRWRCYCDHQAPRQISPVQCMWQCDTVWQTQCDNVTCDVLMIRLLVNTSWGPISQNRTERFSSLLNGNNRAGLNWWSDLNNKRQIIKNIWKIFIDLTSSFLAAHRFSSFQPDQLYP